MHYSNNMEKYIIIISAVITAIAIAYKIANKLNGNTKMFPMVINDGNYVLSFPINSSNQSGNDGYINPINAIKVYFKIKSISIDDIESFTLILNFIDWNNILQSIIKQEDLGEIDYSKLTDVSLSNIVVIQCNIESEPIITADILFNTNSKINIIK